MHEHLSLSEFIRQIIGAELSETQKRILDYLQSNERAESVRALFGQLKLREADELNTWVRDYEAYVIRHQGEWTDSYRQMRDRLAEYSQERIQEVMVKRAGWWYRNGSYGKFGLPGNSLYLMHPDMSPAETEKLKERFKNSLPVVTEEKLTELAAGFKITDSRGGKGVICKVIPDEDMPQDNERPLMIIDSLGLHSPEEDEFWKVHLAKQPRGADLPKSNFVLNLLSQMPEQDRHRFLQRSAERDEYWIDLESEIPNEDWVCHLPAGVTLTGEAAAKLLRSKMERTEKIRQSSLYGTFGVPKGKLAIIDSNFNRGQLFPRMSRSLRSEIREHFGMVEYRFTPFNYRQTGKTATTQAFLDYNLGLLAKDQFVAVTPVSAVASLGFFREFWAPRGSGYILQAKHEVGARRAKKGYKK